MQASREMSTRASWENSFLKWRLWLSWRFWQSFRVKLRINFVFQTDLFSLNIPLIGLTWYGGNVNTAPYLAAAQNF